VHEERLKQQGRLFPPLIFEMLTSTRRLRVSGFFVALTQRTHSQRAIGVTSSHRFWIRCGAAASAAARSQGTLGSGQSRLRPARTPGVRSQLDVIGGLLGRQFPKVEAMLRDFP